jgi:hypothetical protein
MRRVTYRSFGILLCLVGSFSVTMACTCMHLRGYPARTFTASSAVFSGKVLEITEAESSPPATGLKELAVKFRVEKSWKLIRKDEVMVFTVNTSNLCGFPFRVGESYLVYARGGNKLSTDICTRTTLLMGAKEDLEYLKRRQLLKGKKSRT